MRSYNHTEGAIDDWGSPVRLEPAEFNLLWARLRLPAKPLELNVPAQGATLAEAARLTARAEESLRVRGLLTGDEPAPRAAGLLRAVAAPSAQVDLRWADPQAPAELRGLVALRGKHGAMAMWNGESIILRWVTPAVFAETLVAELPETPPGAGRSVTSPAELVLSASRDSAGDAGRFQRRLAAVGIPRDDARVWRDIVVARRLRAGQFGASGMDDQGRLRRARWVIHVFDTEVGRYATYDRGGYRTVVGVRTNQLVRAVRELHADTQPRTGNR